MSKLIAIRITDATIVGGKHVSVGSIHEVELREAVAVIDAGRAVRHDLSKSPVIETASSAPVAAKATGSVKKGK